MEAAYRTDLQPYPTLLTTLSGAAFNGLLLYSMTTEGRIKGFALGVLSSLTVNLSHKIFKDSGHPSSKTLPLHKKVIQPIAYHLAEKMAPRAGNLPAHNRTYYEIRRDTQLILASVISTVVIGLFNHFVLNAPGIRFKGAFALSMVPALYSRSVQIRYDWEENHDNWNMSSGTSQHTQQPIYPYDRRQEY